VRAAKWIITPSAAVDELYTDNLGLRKDSEDRNSDFVTTLTPAISVRGEGGRIKLNGDYSYSQLFHVQEPDADTHRQFLNASGTAEIWEQSVFLDAGASISNQVANQQAAISQNLANLGVNTLETQQWNVAPRFLHHFGTWVETTSVVSHTAISTKQPDNTGANNFEGATSGTVTGSRPIGNSVVDNNYVIAKSGRSFTQFLWTGEVHNNTSSTDTAPHHNDKLAKLSPTYVVNRQLSLNSSLGYRIVNDDALTQSQTGVTYSAGFTYRPGPRVTLDVAWNHDYANDFWTYSGTYNVSPRTTLSFNHTESTTTTAQLLANRQPVLGADGIFRDPVTLLPVDPTVAPTGLQSDTLRQKIWNMTASSRSGRNTYNFNVNRTESDVERTGQVTTQTGAVVTYNRTMTHLLTGSLSANYRFTETTGGNGAAGAPLPGTGATSNGQSTQVLINGALRYTLTPETNLNFTVNYSVFDGGAEQFNSHEKSATIGVRRTF
jgi:hypothetical protein